jgi:drug/metabolite transporter (DMT)-like permease
MILRGAGLFWLVPGSLASLSFPVTALYPLNRQYVVGGVMVQKLPNSTLLVCGDAKLSLHGNAMCTSQTYDFDSCKIQQLDVCATKALQSTSTESGSTEPTQASGDLVIGVVLALVCNWIANYGFILQKLSMDEGVQRAKEGLPSVPYYKQPKFWVGYLVVAIFNVVGNFVSMGFAPASLVTPLGAVSLLANTVNSRIILKEEVTKIDLVGNSLIFFGIIAITSAGAASNTCYALSDFLQMYRAERFLKYMACMFTVVLVLMLLLFALDEFKKHEGGLGSLKAAHKFCFPALGGIIGGLTPIFSKQLAEIVKLAGENTNYNDLDTAGPWCILILMLIVISTQTNYVSRGLELYEQSYVVPVFQVGHCPTF